MIKIHGLILSPFVRKVMAVAKLKKLPYKNVKVFPGTKTADFLSMSPLGKIPALEDGTLRISDSAVICEYLEEKYNDTTIRPVSIEDRAQSRWLEVYGDSKLTELCVGGIYFERFAKKLLGFGETDEDKVTLTIEKLLPPQQDYLERILPAEGFLLGDFGMADICVASPFLSAAHVGYKPDAARWPKLAKFIEQVRAHEAMAELIDDEEALYSSLSKA
jgi:glutathione S-transferase